MNTIRVRGFGLMLTRYEVGKEGSDVSCKRLWESLYTRLQARTGPRRSVGHILVSDHEHDTSAGFWFDVDEI